MSTRILGVDPGLTRLGIGVIDVDARRRLSLVHVEVVRSDSDMPLEARLSRIGEGIERALDEYSPTHVALERVFAQHNVSTVMGTAQASGVVLYAAGKRGLGVDLHTPSEVKAAVTGYGQADKRQVGTMVAKILRLPEAPKPADAADSLALAICAAWKSPVQRATDEARKRTSTLAIARTRAVSAPTPAQAAWLAAERASRNGQGRVR